MQYSVSDQRVKVELIEKQYKYAIDQEECAKKAYSEAHDKMLYLKKILMREKEALERTIEREQFDSSCAVDALKSLRKVIYSKSDWEGSLGDAYRDICKKHGWCAKCSLDEGGPQSQTDCYLHLASR